MTNKIIETPTRNIRKKQEFDTFIKTIKKGSIPHWIKIAEAIGVNKDTITEWKKLPEAQQAILEGICHDIKQMETSGKRDWRMWREKLKMLGIRDTDEFNETSEEMIWMWRKRK